MDKWPDDFTKLLDQWLEPTATAIEDFLTEFQQTLEEVGEEIITTLEYWERGEGDRPEGESYAPPPINLGTEDNYGWLNPKITATTNVHPTCIGCQHYHGRVYNNSILVCGMHPYGADTSHCADWEGETTNLD
ncbi:MAG: hypothetical protein ACRC6M_10930 [Microcystaceae cyanobacterium]